MAKRLKIALLKASLPSYFPERHDVWARAEAMIGELCSNEEADLAIHQKILVDGEGTKGAIEWCGDEGVDFVLLLHGGFTMGDVALTLAKTDCRIGICSVPEPTLEGDIQLNNFVSLNMSMSIARTVRDLAKKPIQWYHGKPESKALQGRVRTTLRALRACKALEGVTIGTVGGLAKTFYNLETSDDLLKERLGFSVERHGMEVLTDRMKDLAEDRVAAEQSEMESSAKVDGVSDRHMMLSARCALALKDLADEKGLSALAVSDWPSLQEDPCMHPGAAFSWLEEKHGLPVASEGDVLGAATLLAALAICGKTGCLLDMTEPDLEDGSLLVWHGGGGPLHLADGKGVRWINHPMLGRDSSEGATTGAIADFVFADGAASVFRIARNGGALFSMAAKVTGREVTGYDGARGWLKDFVIDGRQASLDDLLATVLGHGIEHHFILVAGSFANEVAEFGAWCGMETLGLIPHQDHLDTSGF